MNASINDFVQLFNLEKLKNHDGYPNCGELYKGSNNKGTFTWWGYSTDQFRVSIHNMFFKEEFIMDLKSSSRALEYKVISSYLLSAHGECLNPYQPICDHMMMIWEGRENGFRFALHGGFPYASVDVEFKSPMIKDYLIHQCGFNTKEVMELFKYFSIRVPNGIKELATEIMECKMDIKAEEIFLESKAKQWLAIVVSTYFEELNRKPLEKEDQLGIENVANYINDHYAYDIPQELLAKIALMSKTKLRTAFKEKYNMTITEYTQRRRMAMAEVMLYTTDLSIRKIARSVGYESHSRFSNLYFKYMGMYPREVERPCIKHTHR